MIDDQKEPETVRESLEAAFEEHAPEPDAKADAPAEPDKAVDTGRDEAGRFKEKTDAPVDTPAPVVKAAPAAWSGTKEEFSALPPAVQDRIIQREEEVHKGFTKLDEERNLGKSMKEVITPYMAIIQAEGGTPQGAVKDLLNTAYILRTGTPQQKAQIAAQIIQQYGVDMRLFQQPQQQQQQFQQQPVVDQDKIKQDILAQLQEQQNIANMNSEIQAFGADPKNVHFNNPEVKARMASLLGSGNAKSMQDAYDQATWAVPEIRTTLLSAQQADQDAKRKSELDAKRKAGSSVSGSPGLSMPNSGNPDRSLREEIAANMAALGH